MTINVTELRGRRNQLCADAKKLLDDTKDKPWSADNQVQYDNLTNEISDIDGKLQRHQKILDLEAENKFSDRDLVKKDFDPADPKNAVKNIHDKWIRQGWDALNVDEIKTIRNTMSVGTGSQGGYTVPSLVASEYIDALKGYRGVREVAQSLVTQDGLPFSFPTTDGTSEVGELIAENTTATAADPSFGTVSLSVFKYSSKIIAVPFELLQDTVIDIETLIRNRIRDRLGRINNQHFTTGTGSGQPNGFVTASSVGKTGTTGQTTTVIYDDLVDTVDSLDYAYQTPGVRWMMAQSSRKVARKIKDTTGRPIWAPGEGTMIDGFQETLLGYPISLNNDMPAMAANAKSIAFGDFSKYIVRDAMEISLFRFTDSAYVKLGQVGFMAWQRCGGNLVDTNAIKLYQNSAT